MTKEFVDNKNKYAQMETDEWFKSCSNDPYPKYLLKNSTVNVLSMLVDYGHGDYIRSLIEYHHLVGCSRWGKNKGYYAIEHAYAEWCSYVLEPLLFTLNSKKVFDLFYKDTHDDSISIDLIINILKFYELTRDLVPKSTRMIDSRNIVSIFVRSYYSVYTGKRLGILRKLRFGY